MIEKVNKAIELGEELDEEEAPDELVNTYRLLKRDLKYCEDNSTFDAEMAMENAYSNLRQSTFDFDELEDGTPEKDFWDFIYEAGEEIQ